MPEESIGYAEVLRASSSSKLNLREDASTKSKSLGRYPHGTMVTVLDLGTSWCHVRIGSVEGYMSTRYLSFNGITGKPTMQVVHPDESYVNLRSAPKQEDNVLVRVPHGATVTVVAHGKSWCQVTYNGVAGYMMTVYLSE